AQRPANNFVDGIVAANILAFGEKFPAGVEQAGRVKTTCAAKNLLRRSKRVRNAAQHLSVNAKMWIRCANAACAHRFNGCLAANATTRRSKEIALRVFEIQRDIISQFNLDDVAPLRWLAIMGVVERDNLFTMLDDAFGE